MEAIVYERDKCVGVAAGKEIRIWLLKSESQFSKKKKKSSQTFKNRLSLSEILLFGLMNLMVKAVEKFP